MLSAELKPSESHPLRSLVCPNLTEYSYILSAEWERGWGDEEMGS
uniref:Uncharacterized protein n=1 Tax=Desertifilum tharense IPPAS B-1220 TaxID=1781255 RepID=A0ACD5H0I0_9CYAN